MKKYYRHGIKAAIENVKKNEMDIPLDLHLETDRLILRCREIEDNEMIFSATRYEGFNDGMLWNPPESIDELHPRVILSKENWEKGISYQMIIVRKGD